MEQTWSEWSLGWFMSYVRALGTTNPVSAPFVQLQAEYDRVATDKRLNRLEDPISNLHPDVPEVSELIYRAVAAKDDGGALLDVDDAFYERFPRPLAILEARGLIAGTHTFGRRFHNGLRVSDPMFLVYMASRFEDPTKLEQLHDLVDGAPPRQWLHGMEIAPRLGVPLLLVDAMFRIYTARGLGLRSEEIGAVAYYQKV